VIPARVRSFSITTIMQVTGWSRTSLWRRKQRGRLGVDVINFVQRQRANEGLPALSPEAEQDLLTALVAVEDAHAAEAVA
jgi:hypothetical protein